MSTSRLAPILLPFYPRHFALPPERSRPGDVIAPEKERGQQVACVENAAATEVFGIDGTENSTRYTIEPSSALPHFFLPPLGPSITIFPLRLKLIMKKAESGRARGEAPVVLTGGGGGRGKAQRRILGLGSNLRPIVLPERERERGKEGTDSRTERREKGFRYPTLFLFS